MEISRSEWLKAQGLLVQLVRVLTPLTQQEEGLLSLFPQKLSLEEKSFSHSVRLLSTLQTAKKEMEQWVQEEIPVASSEPNRSLPVRGQAQRLIDQVRTAIQNLSSFANLEHPKVAPFRDAIKKLKPLIDELIESVSRGDAAEEGSRQHRAVPLSQREERFKKRELLARELAQKISRQEVALPTSPTSSLFSSRVKKKRKSLWLREEREEEEKSLFP